jgi:hypothetical protein
VRGGQGEHRDQEERSIPCTSFVGPTQCRLDGCIITWSRGRQGNNGGRGGGGDVATTAAQRQRNDSALAACGWAGASRRSVCVSSFLIGRVAAPEGATPRGGRTSSIECVTIMLSQSLAHHTHHHTATGARHARGHDGGAGGGQWYSTIGIDCFDRDNCLRTVEFHHVQRPVLRLALCRALAHTRTLARMASHPRGLHRVNA